MIELKNIHINLSQNGRQIIEDFSFTLNRGEKAVIIGEEGNGKSTLLKYIYDEKLIDSYCEYSGTVIKKGRLAYLPQEIDERYWMYLFMNIFQRKIPWLISTLFQIWICLLSLLNLNENQNSVWRGEGEDPTCENNDGGS